jgi:thiosulfate/3-mercaptopyruvate sulfurtransferase
MTLVSTDWLDSNLSKVKILDASWHMPSTKRDAEQEFLINHIPNSQFFDLDKNSDSNNPLPHMLPSKEKWKEIISNFGIENDDYVIIYDDSDVISSCRCWYMFIYFGHDIKKISVLNGGLKKWKNENRKLTKDILKLKKTNYQVTENKNLVKNKEEIDSNITSKKFNLVDARGKKRFDGIEPEPRQGLRSGHIPNSKNLPFMECINNDRTFKSKKELQDLFAKMMLDKKNNMVFTCGSGVTACVLALANYVTNDMNPVIYDGSWSEYGIIK